MFARPCFDNTRQTSLYQLIADMCMGEIHRPDFSRATLREDQQILLFDSIIRGIPIGGLLVWRSSRHIFKLKEPTSYEFLDHSPTPSDLHPRTYIIDGNQRADVLYSALSWTRFNLYMDKRTLGFDFKTMKFSWVIISDSQPYHWFPLHRMFNAKQVWQTREVWRKKDFNAEADNLELLSAILLDYQIPITDLITRDLALVQSCWERSRINPVGYCHDQREALQKQWDDALLNPNPQTSN